MVGSTLNHQTWLLRYRVNELSSLAKFSELMNRFLLKLPFDMYAVALKFKTKRNPYREGLMERNTFFLTATGKYDSLFPRPLTLQVGRLEGQSSGPQEPRPLGSLGSPGRARSRLKSLCGLGQDRMGACRRRRPVLSRIPSSALSGSHNF